MHLITDRILNIDERKNWQWWQKTSKTLQNPRALGRERERVFVCALCASRFACSRSSSSSSFLPLLKERWRRSIYRWQWHHGGFQFCVLFPFFFWRFFCYVFLLLAPWWTRRRKRPRARWPPGRRMWSISSVVFVRRLWSSFLVKWRRSVTKLLQKRFGSHVCVLLSLFALFFSSSLLP